MKKLLLLLVLFPAFVYAQDASKKSLLPSSEISMLYDRKGAIKTETYVILNDFELLVTKAIIVTDMETKETKGGIELQSFMITDSGSHPVKYYAKLDIDEIDKCMEMLVYFQENIADTPADSVQSQYSYNSRCGATIGVATDHKAWTVYVKPVSESAGSHVFLKIEDLPALIDVFKTAKNILFEKNPSF